MRSVICQIVFLFAFILSGSIAMAGDASLPDTVYGVPRERFSEFRDAYMVTQMFYGEQSAPNHIVGYFGEVSSDGSPVNAVLGFMEINRDIFGLQDIQTELKLDTIETAEDGSRTVVLQQMHDGLKVDGCHIKFWITPKNEIELITGRYFPDLSAAEKPKVDSVAAIGIVRDSLATAGDAPVKLGYSLCILPFKRSFPLVWRVDQPVPDDGGQRSRPIYVDALSGVILPRGAY